MFCLIEVSSLIFIALGQGFQQGIVRVFLKTFWESAECCISLMPSLKKPRTDDRCWCVDSLTHRFKSRFTRSQFILNSKWGGWNIIGRLGRKLRSFMRGFFGYFNKAGHSVFVDKVVFGLREEVVEVFVVLVLFPKHLKFVF